MIGRRVATFDDIHLAGDYCGPEEITLKVDPETQEPIEMGRVVWFLLPIHEGTDKYERPTRGSGIHAVYEPPWVFRECDDGSVEIRESIACGRHDVDKETNEPLGEYWHGYLDEGHVWRTC